MKLKDDLFTRDTTQATLSMPMLKTPASLQTGLVVRGQGLDL